MELTSHRSIILQLSSSFSSLHSSSIGLDMAWTKRAQLGRGESLAGGDSPIGEPSAGLMVVKYP